jgi:hypothetical protein
MPVEVFELGPAERALVNQPSILGNDKHGTRNRVLDRGANERVCRRNPVREAGVGARYLSKERKGEERRHDALGGDFNQLRVAAETADTTLTPLTRSSAVGLPAAESRAETL